MPLTEQTQQQSQVDACISDFIDLTARKRELEEDLRNVKAQLAAVEPVITEHFQRYDQQSVSRNGWTVYRSRDVSIKSATGETADVVSKLRKARLGELIGLNWPRIRSWVKEKMFDDASGTWEVDMAKLPPSLRGIVVIEEFYRLNCRKAS